MKKNSSFFNQDRRTFFKKAIKIVTVGGISTILPTTAYSNFIYDLEKFTDPYFDFEAYEDAFQADTKRHRVDGAVQIALDEKGSTWEPGEGKDGQTISPLAKAMREAYDPLPQITTPAANLITNKGFDIKGQVIRNPDGKQITMMVKGQDGQIYPVPFCFTTVLELKEYYCYGLPASFAVRNTCRNCGSQYFNQKFYYNGSNVLDPNKKYSSVTTDFTCDGNGMKCTQSKTGFHNELVVNTISPCVCEDQYRPILNSNVSKF